MFAETLTEDRAEKALTFLAKTDEEYSRLKADVARTEYAAKLAEHRAYLLAEGSIPERKATAELSADAQSAWDKHFDTVQAFETLRAKRFLNEQVLDIYRSVFSARKAGMII